MMIVSSCLADGSRAIYNGTFSGTKIAGAGVTAALLRRHGITVLSEEDAVKSGDVC
ncbi:DUF523 domain-containing protein [Domibacillus enclensis]|nr:Protein of unknown function [Domibacillus enclensis]